VEGPTWNIRKPQGLFSKTTGGAWVDPYFKFWPDGLGDLGRRIWIVLRVQPWTGRWTWSTDPWWTGAKGVTPDLIWIVDRWSGSLGCMWATHGGGWWSCGGARRQAAGSSPTLPGIELGGSNWIAGGLKTKRRTRRTQPRARGDG
jgi:hypothetical protein